MLLALTLTTLTLTGLGVFVWYLVAAPSSQLLGASLSRGNRSSNAIALTFDDGPGHDTPAILDLLKQRGIVATFFLCGENVERHPDLARRIAEEGHEIGNHTYSHLRMLWKSPGRMMLEIERTQRVIAHRTGQAPQVFRPPYGLRWFGLFPVLESAALKNVMWSVNAKDWKRPAGEIAVSVLKGAQPGAIVLLHDGVPPQESGDRKPTVQALGEILGSLGTRYQFVRVSQMF